MNEKLKFLKEKILRFVEAQEGFPGFHQPIQVFGGGQEYVVIYGPNFQRGITGIGSNPMNAYEEFVRSWVELRGFNWINSNPPGMHP